MAPAGSPAFLCEDGGADEGPLARHGMGTVNETEPGWSVDELAVPLS